MNKRTIGLTFSDDLAFIRVWAPLAGDIKIKYGPPPISLKQADLGFWDGNAPGLKPGDEYCLVLNGERELPDPASLSQPKGVNGRSRAVNLETFNWTDQNWVNPAIKDYIFYELHTGTFSPEGNFRGIINKLDYLAGLGITAVEIMPVAQFPGDRNWGYDGVFPFAVQYSYGGAYGLQELVDACHKKGLAVVLDVVYNHLGPEGNYLPALGPFFTEKYKTPWGNAVNFDDAWCDGVRHFFIENAMMWFRDFHIDALRLDAVHAIKDLSPKHILQEMREKTDELSRLTGKRYYLIIECDLNDTRFIDSPAEKGYGMTAQWTDEFHHALRVTAGQKREGYYSDFNGIADLAKAYRAAYVYDGQYSEQRHRNFGVKTINPGSQFIVFSQNHDQVGNRMLGERTSALVSFEMQKLLAAAVIVSPYLPLFFMGEEMGETNPFLYFVSHSDKQLIKSVRDGRRSEFKAFHLHGEAPDPQDEHTFLHSKLQWRTDVSPGEILIKYYQELIKLRKNFAALNIPDRESLSVDFDEDAGTLILRRWRDRQNIMCIMNFAAQARHFYLKGDHHQWEPLFNSADSAWLGKGKLALAVMPGQKIYMEPESIIIYSQKHV